MRVDVIDETLVIQKIIVNPYGPAISLTVTLEDLRADPLVPKEE